MAVQGSAFSLMGDKSQYVSLMEWIEESSDLTAEGKDRLKWVCESARGEDFEKNTLQAHNLVFGAHRGQRRSFFAEFAERSGLAFTYVDCLEFGRRREECKGLEPKLITISEPISGLGGKGAKVGNAFLIKSIGVRGWINGHNLPYIYEDARNGLADVLRANPYQLIFFDGIDFCDDADITTLFHLSEGNLKVSPETLDALFFYSTDFSLKPFSSMVDRWRVEVATDYRILSKWRSIEFA